MVECDTADTGFLQVPGALIIRLLGLGVAGFSTLVLSRRSTGSVVLSAGRVDLVIASDLEREVQIAGLVSCNEDADCPSGLVCQSDLSCK